MNYTKERTRKWKALLGAFLIVLVTFLIMKLGETTGMAESSFVLLGVFCLGLIGGFMFSRNDFQFRRELKKSAVRELIKAGQTFETNLEELMKYIKIP